MAQDLSSITSGKKRKAPILLHHSDAAAIGTDPSRTICHTPFVFFKTWRTNLKTAGAVPAE